jgi:hypothetical protein
MPRGAARREIANTALRGAALRVLAKSRNDGANDGEKKFKGP